MIATRDAMVGLVRCLMCGLAASGALASFAAVAPSAHADRIETSAATIDDCRVQAIRSSTVFYVDAAGDIRQIGVADVTSIEFDDLPEVRDAERLIARRRFVEALDRLLAAYVKTEDEAKRLWLHARLAHVHSALGDYVEAAGHLAAVLVEDASAHWLTLQPMGDVRACGYYAAAEAADWLSRAARRVEGDEPLTQAVEVMTAKVQPVLAELQASHEQLRYRHGSTVSGVFLRDVGTERAKKERPWLEVEAAGTNEIAPPPGTEATGAAGGATDAPSPPAPPEIAPRGSNSPAVIDAMLDRGDFDAALAVCERLAERIDERDLAEFLFQYGRALDGAGRSLDAAVCFVECAAHFGGSVHGVRSLIATAAIYRDRLGQPEAAMRLVEEAAARAAHIGDEALADEARRQMRN
jgi:tetratricopeptide (TPR) repeat protein